MPHVVNCHMVAYGPRVNTPPSGECTIVVGKRTINLREIPSGSFEQRDDVITLGCGLRCQGEDLQVNGHRVDTDKLFGDAIEITITWAKLVMIAAAPTPY